MEPIPQNDQSQNASPKAAPALPLACAHSILSPTAPVKFCQKCGYGIFEDHVIIRSHKNPSKHLTTIQHIQNYENTTNLRPTSRILSRRSSAKDSSGKKPNNLPGNSK
jgi:hypothetical protein